MPRPTLRNRSLEMALYSFGYQTPPSPFDEEELWPQQPYYEPEPVAPRWSHRAPAGLH